MLDRHAPSDGGLVGIGGPDGAEMGNDTASRQVFDRLVRGAVLPKEDAVMSEDVNRVGSINAARRSEGRK